MPKRVPNTVSDQTSIGLDLALFNTQILARLCRGCVLTSGVKLTCL